ncbi:MAG: adenosine deaminase [Fimbriimonadaceae bacterium]|nr:adenosine deaminase [Fimbriimonadaceae bacterium]
MTPANPWHDRPKVELHVHLEGSIQPETLLELARRNEIALPGRTVEELRDWYRFRDFDHFVSVYIAITSAIRTPDDLRLVWTRFIDGQHAQNVLHTEVTFTAGTVADRCGIPWRDQLAVLADAQAYARSIGVSVGVILDIVRGDSPERAQSVLEWVREGRDVGVVALGLAGDERLPADGYRATFAAAIADGIPIIPHAGEFTDADAVRAIVELTQPARIEHGLGVLTDPYFTREIADRQIALDVCPSSNVCLHAAPSWDEHPLPRMLDAGLCVTINSDDAPMFNTTLTDEWAKCETHFGFDADIGYSLTLNAVNAAILPISEKVRLREQIRDGYAED